MTEPKRLLDSAPGECDAFEADLLRAARGDAMSASSKRALVAAALGGALALSAAAQATPLAAAAAKVGTSAFAKWVVIGLVGSGLVISAGLLLVRAPAPAATAPPPAMPTAAPPEATTTTPTAIAIAPSAPAAPTRSDPAPVARRPAVSSSAASPVNAPDDLAAETTLLDEARDAVARHDGAAALVLLAEHTRAFPRPALADEAFVLRAEALSAQGDGARLRALATPWLASHATSPYAPRVRRALAHASTTTGDAAP